MANYLALKLRAYNRYLQRWPTNPSMFEELDIESKIIHHLVDVRDLSALTSIIDKHKPDYAT